MKPIELTEEHKTKLLKMCKVLFPEYDVRLTKPLYSTPDAQFVQLGKKQLTKYEAEIHWFEFCVKILTPKILSYGIEQLGSECLDNNKNLIDYLYEEFKKLKQ
jgi:hypothetical protein